MLLSGRCHSTWISSTCFSFCCDSPGIEGTEKENVSLLSGASIRRQALDFPHRPDFNSSDPHSGNPGSDVDRLVEIPGIDQEIAANLLARLREWTVSHQAFPVAYLHADGRRCRL